MQGVQDSDTTVYHVIDQTTASHLGPPRSSTELYASLVSYVFLAVASIFGNILVIGAYVKNERLQRDIRYTFIIGLACADLLVGLVSLPIWIYITFSDHNDTPFHRTLYQVYITVDIFIGSASILQLAGISVERSYAVVRPVKHRLLNRKTLNNAVAVTWLFSAALASIQPLQYGTHWQMIYTMVMTTLCFFIPTVVIITAYCCIFATIKTKKTMANHRTNKNCFTKEVRLSFTVAMITLLFVITWLPLFSLTLLATFNPKALPPSNSSERLSHFVKWMHYCSSALNPFLYAYRHKDLYRTLVVLLRRPVFKKCPRVDEDLRSYRSGSVGPSNGVRKLYNPRNRKRKSSSNKQKRIALSDTTANSSWIIYETSRKRKKPDDHCTVV